MKAESSIGGLQWGRGLKATEIHVRVARGRDVRRASMGPRPEGHGNQGVSDRPGSDVPASMGPRPEGHGNRLADQRPQRSRPASMGPRPEGHGNSPENRSRFGEVFTLQWGRGLKATEMSMP